MKSTPDFNDLVKARGGAGFSARGKKARPAAAPKAPAPKTGQKIAARPPYGA
jgi:hypothetical protein